MHILGKILTWLTVIAAGASVVLAARVLQIRNSWTKQVEELEQQSVKAAAEVEAKRTELAHLQNAYERARVQWGSYWTDRGGNRFADPNNPGQYGLIMGVGSPEGMGAGRRQGKNFVLHAFRETGPGQSRYIGPFRLDSVTNQNSRGLPEWAVDAEVDNPDQLWTQGKWRFRENVPSAVPGLLLDYYSQVRTEREKLKGQRARLAEITRTPQEARQLSQQTGEVVKPGRKAIATAELEENLKVLRGDPNAGPGGLVKELADVEEQRNAVIGQLDALRRTIKDSKDSTQALEAGNRKLLESLAAKKKASATGD